MRAGVFAIRTIAVVASVSIVLFHCRGECVRRSVVPVEEIRALVRVAVAAEHEVHSAGFENRLEDSPHFDVLGLRIRIMRTLRVRRMMIECDDPFLRSCGEIVGEPLLHRAIFHTQFIRL